MKKIYKIINFFITISLFSLFVFPKEVRAYIDAGSGSYLAQVLVGTILGGIFAFKSFWSKIKPPAFKGKDKFKKKNGYNQKK